MKAVIDWWLDRVGSTIEDSELFGGLEHGGFRMDRWVGFEDEWYLNLRDGVVHVEVSRGLVYNAFGGRVRRHVNHKVSIHLGDPELFDKLEDCAVRYFEYRRRREDGLGMSDLAVAMRDLVIRRLGGMAEECKFGCSDCERS